MNAAFSGLAKLTTLLIFSVKEFLNPNSMTFNYACNSIGGFYNHNWGDDVNLELARLIYKTQIIPYPYSLLSRLLKRKTNIVFVGSIIPEYANENSIIIGAGVRSETQTMKTEYLKKIISVRGPLTKKYLERRGFQCPEVFGDPVLLFSLFYKPKILLKKHRIGIIPHFRERNEKLIHYLKNDPNVLFIDIVDYGDCYSFVDKVLSCDVILSSSLHGLILSDSYGIKNLWVSFSNDCPDAKFKYQDYFASVGRAQGNPIVLNNCNLDNLDEVELLVEKNYTKPLFSKEEYLNIITDTIKMV